MNNIDDANGHPDIEPIDIGYRVSQHELDIINFFKQHSGDVGIKPTDVPSSDNEAVSIFICFTNRCGSNLLAATLASTGKIPNAGEFFNSEFVINFSKKRDITSFHDFLIRLRETHSKNGIFASKLGISQLFFLKRIGAFDAVFPNPVFVHIVRKDVLGQAISFSIASQTLAWTSQQESNGENIIFDAQDIRNRIVGITKENMRFTQLFALTGINPISVTYEALVGDPQGEVNPVLQAVGFKDSLPINRNAIKLKKQRNETNDRFREKFLTECEKIVVPAHNILSEIVQDQGIRKWWKLW